MAGVALFLLLAVLAACGSTPQPTEPPATQTPWVVVVTSTSGPGQTAEAQPAATTAPTRRPTAEPTNPLPTQAPTRTSAAAGTTPDTATPTTEAEETPSPPVATAATPRPTSTPGSAGSKYPPPVLLEPPANRPVSWGSTVLLIWTPVGDLEEDEYYHVHMERRPRSAQEPWYGDYVYTKDTEFLAEGTFLAPFHPSHEHGHGIVYWWVRVVRQTGEDQNGKPIGIDLSPSSEERTLILEPKPGG